MPLLEPETACFLDHVRDRLLPGCGGAGLEFEQVGKSDPAMPTDHTVRDLTAVEQPN